MRKRVLLFLLLCNSIELFSQEKINSNKLGFSIPIIWNNSNGVYYSLGNRKEPNGNAISYGVNINYSHFFYGNFFIVGGVGYFNQKFDIKRPFQYRTPDGSEPLISTKNYTYQNVNLLMGMGYQKMISDKWSLAGQLSYNMYNSFSQKYEQAYTPGINEVYKKHLMAGNMLNLDFKCERNLTNRISIGAAIVLPVFTHWNDDKIFNKYDYADDTQIIAHTKFSFGTNVSVYYQFKNKRL